MRTEGFIALLVGMLAPSILWADFPSYCGETYTVGQKSWTGIDALKEAAHKGDFLAQYAYAWALEEGKGIKVNEAEADRLFADVVTGLKSLADKGDIDAMTALAGLYEEGTGVKVNKELAAQWYAKAAEKGHAYAMYCLAECYKTGNGVMKSLEEAKEWYQRAANAGLQQAQEALANWE